MRMIVALLLAIFAADARAFDLSTNDLKTQNCRLQTTSLIGVKRDQIRERCGIWRRHEVVNMPGHKAEALIFPYLTIYLRDDIVVGTDAR